MNKKEKEEVAHLYKKGWTNKAISEKTGISPWKFIFILQKKNILLKGRREPAIDKELQERTMRMY